jgi:TonB family protein
MSLLRGSCCLLFALLAHTGAIAGEQEGRQASVIRELSWPEMDDPHAMVQFARAQIEKHKGDAPDGRSLSSLVVPGAGRLKLMDVIVYPGMLMLILDTRPYTGQIYLVSPDAGKRSKREEIVWSEAEETDDLRIRRGLLKFFGHYYTNMPQLSDVSVRWQDVRNLDEGNRSWPVIVKMRLPDYPADMIAAGINGSTSIEFVVSSSGKVAGVKILSSHPEFERSVREAIEAWTFIPGVAADTRKPADTRISVNVEFSCVGD